MSFTFFRKAAVVSLTVAGTTGVSCIYRYAPEALSQEFPALELGDDAVALKDLWGCMRFLDERQGEWKVESSNFPQKNWVSQSSDEPKVQVLRLDSSYSADSMDGRPAPFMRVVGFFPDTPPEEVFGFMTDLKLRREWDLNYHMFRKWDDAGSEADVVANLGAIRRPIEMTAKKTPVCQGDSCLLLPDVTQKTIEQGWFAHRVGHSLLDKFGIADRLFVYQRRSVCYTKREEEMDNTLRMYDVLYSGTGDVIEKTLSKSKPFASWLHLCECERKAIRVSINYQHILILPIADVASQLLEDPSRLSCSGSMVDNKTTKTVYNTFIDSVRLHRQSNKIDGTLMIMTSANDAQIPSSVPMWAQRMLASFFSNHAYREMLRAIRSHRGQKKT